MKTKLFILALLAPVFAMAQEETPWVHSGITGINFSQTSFTNWSEGGDNSVASNAYLNGSLNYKKDKISWTNDLSINYGQNNTKMTGWRKNIDNLNFASKFGQQMTEKVYYAALLDFKTQMTDGYQYNNAGDRTLISKFLTPAYLNVSVGLDYKPNDNLAFYFSPVAGKLTITADTLFSTRYGVDPGKMLRTQLGATFKASCNYDKLMNGKMTLKSALDLFTAYDDSFGNIDVNWDMLVGLNLSKFVTLTFQSTLKYDDDIKYIDEDGIHGARVQFKEILGLGLSYKF
ncbi:MAG: DUF3078 domain-containing protein [Bacteroidaceae bacterium]|nr:DUF3078 domain-containing protein [Bacteroidaceae bacterium]